MGNKKNIINVGYLISYDYAFIFTSIKQIYNEADHIVICYDADSKTWSGNHIHIPESFFTEIKKIDNQNKITFYKDTFYIAGLQPMELDTRQRNMMAKKMGKSGWYIQIDGDEYAYDFKVLAEFLRKNKYLLAHPKQNPINFQVNFVTLFKQNEDGFFVISPFVEKCMLITNYPVYEYARLIRKGRTLPLDFFLIHQSWARKESEIIEKINNWGHKNDFDTAKFLDQWKQLSSQNYQEFNNFHPLESSHWQELSFFPAKNIEEFILSFSAIHPQKKLHLNLSSTKKIKLWIKSLF